jgi:hypothetical protein
VIGTGTLSATASAASGLSVTRVDFKIDGSVVGTASTSPYTVMWNSTTVSKGNHTLTATVTDSAGGTATTPAITITVQNMANFAVAMSAAQIFPMPTSSASGEANLTVDLDSGATSGKVTLSGIAATAVTINEAFAGATGSRVIVLNANDTGSAWEVPAGALLTADQVTALRQGKLYMIASSTAHPSGEVRGQITPSNVTVVFSSLSGTQDVPSLTIAAAGIVATTVDTTTHTLTLQVNSTGVDDSSAAEIDTAAADATGVPLAALSKDSVNMGHWSTELTPIAVADVANFNAGNWYVKVATPVAPNGAIRGQIH